MGFLSKVELKRQLREMGVKVEGNYVKKKDIEKIIAESKHWYAHARRHNYVLDLGMYATEKEALDALVDTVVGQKRHGWLYDTADELLKAIKLDEVYVSNNPSH